MTLCSRLQFVVVTSSRMDAQLTRITGSQTDWSIVQAIYFRAADSATLAAHTRDSNGAPHND